MQWQGSLLQASGFSDGLLGCFETIISNNVFIPKILEVKIIPNPNNGKFKIALADDEGLSWILYNMNGKIALSGNSLEIEASNLAKGIYSLHIKTHKGSAFAKILIDK
jgi:hypothetical protein